MHPTDIAPAASCEDSLSDSNREPRPAHQFDDWPQHSSAATFGMWLFLTAELMFFGGLFAIYMVYRSTYPVVFAEASQHLDLVLGTANTAVLLTSSFTMALAVGAAKARRRWISAAMLGTTIVLACVFLAIKGLEYAHKFQDQHVPVATWPFDWEPASAGPARLFFALYFVMTGVHALHIVLGAGALLAILVMNARGRFNDGNFLPVETVGLYWHLVDVIWIFLFPLLYLIHPHAG
jgi:cytochrome c oxidase subunit 3